MPESRDLVLPIRRFSGRCAGLRALAAPGLGTAPDSSGTTWITIPRPHLWLPRKLPVRRSAPLNELCPVPARLSDAANPYTGAGKVGGNQRREEPHRESGSAGSVPFQLSQRADYIQNDLFEWVQFNRAIIQHPR